MEELKVKVTMINGNEKNKFVGNAIYDNNLIKYINEENDEISFDYNKLFLTKTSKDYKIELSFKTDKMCVYIPNFKAYLDLYNVKVKINDKNIDISYKIDKDIKYKLEVIK